MAAHRYPLRPGRVQFDDPDILGRQGKCVLVLSLVVVHRPVDQAQAGQTQLPSGAFLPEGIVRGLKSAGNPVPRRFRVVVQEDADPPIDGDLHQRPWVSLSFTACGDQKESEADHHDVAIHRPGVYTRSRGSLLKRRAGSRR